MTDSFRHARDDPRQRFGPAAHDYARWRPDYPSSLLDWIIETTGVRPPARVAGFGYQTIGLCFRVRASATAPPAPSSPGVARG